MAVLERIETGAKNLFSGRKKWLILGGLAALVVVIFVLRKRSSSSDTVQLSSYPTTGADYTGSIGAGGGTAGGVTSDDLALIRDNFSQQLADLEEKFNEAQQENTKTISELSQQNQALAQATTASLQDLSSSFADKLSDLSSGFADKISDLNSDFSQQISHLSGAISGLQVSPIYNPSAGSTPTGGTAGTPTQYNVPVGVSSPAVAQSTPSSASSSQSPYTYKEGGITYVVDKSGNIYKDNRYVAPTASNMKYIPTNVLNAAHQAHQNLS